MRLCLINLWGPCPPDGYRYVDPVSGFLAHAWTYVDWIAVEKAHLHANKREIPETLEADMQEQLCLTLPPGWCLYDDDNRPRPTTSIGWDDVASGLKTFARWVGSGCKYVPQAEAERRAVICSRCYLNVNVQGCSGCHKAVAEVVRDKHTKLDLSLRACAVCKCFLKAKVHFPINTLDTSSPGVQGMYPGFCWLNRKSENYKADTNG
jgi:hypothetical protein